MTRAIYPVLSGLPTGVHPSFLPPMFCAACEDSGQELDGSPCLDCGGDSYPRRLAHEKERRSR